VNTDETAAVSVEETNLGMPTGLLDPINLKAGQAKRTDGVSERRAH
jgi:hypothetical protein